jgi:hypothetical protein
MSSNRRRTLTSLRPAPVRLGFPHHPHPVPPRRDRPLPLRPSLRSYGATGPLAREYQFPNCGRPATVSGSTTVEFREHVRGLFPLPEGEGQGEGKQVQPACPANSTNHWFFQGSA